LRGVADAGKRAVVSRAALQGILTTSACTRNAICTHTQFNTTTKSFHTSAPLRNDSMFSSLGGRLKKLWKGEGAVKEEPKEVKGETTAPPSDEVPMTPEERAQAEKEDQKLMENIETGKFDLNDYQREISRLLKMAKAKGAIDSVKGKVTSLLGKKEQAPDAMKGIITDFESQITLLGAMTEDEKKNPDAFYDHAFKTKQRISSSAGQTLENFNLLMGKYEHSRAVYMVLHEVRRRGKDIPSKTDDILPFVQENFHLLSDKDKVRLKKYTKKK